MRWLAGAALLVWTACGWGASLGSMEVLSSLGQPLRVKVPLSNYHPDDGPNCVRATLRAIDGGLALHPRVGLIQNGNFSSLQLTTRESINEPAVNIVISLGCNAPLQRDYQILLDPQLTPATVPRTQPEPAAARVREKPVRSAPPPRTAQAPSDEVVVTEAPRPRKPARNRIAAEASNATDSAAAVAKPLEQPAPIQKAAKRRPKKVERSVLRLSGAALPAPAGNAAALATPAGGNAAVEPQAEPVDAPMQLKRADSLTLPELPTSPGRMAELQAEQEKFAALLRDEDPVQAVQQSMRKVQAELESVRAETARLKEQSQNDKTALATLRADSLHWIGTLGWLLLICLSAIAWLIWRLSAAKNEASRAEWAALVAARNTQTAADFDIPEDMQVQAALPHAADPVVEQRAAPEAAPAPSKPEQPVREQTAAEDAAAPADEPQQAVESTPAASESAGVPPYLLRPVGANTASRAADHSLKAAEISDVVELAEAWMALNDPHKVLELLDPFAAVEHPESPLPWLCLLEVYRTLGQQEKYEAILERIRSRFNVKLAPWNEETDGEPPKTLADYPHISANIISLWENTADVVAYLQQLQRDNRHGTRNGFDLPVYRDILKLISLAEHAEHADGKAVMPERVRGILFPAPREAAAPAPAAPRAVGTAAKVQLPVRPRYVTTSYQQRALRERTAAQPSAAAVRPAPEPTEQPAAAPPSSRSAAAAIVNTTARPSGVAVTQQAVKKEKWPAYPAPAAALAKAASAMAAPATTAPQVQAQPQRQSQPQPQPVTQKAPEPHEDLCPIGVKLHLAVAYHDIGDKEGAYVLLNEVVNEGDQAQVEHARKLMSKLGV
jgi:pilus assembly protein FimV